jgi:two-component system sensor histidine kinase DegS
MAGYEPLDRVARKALNAIEEGREAIFGIAEAAHSKLVRLQPMLEAAAGWQAEDSPAACLSNRDQSGQDWDLPGQDWDALKQERDSLLQVKEQADMLLTRFGVALQFLQGVVPDGELADDRLDRKKVGQLVIRMLENERRRIAREIHDGPAQGMANLLLKTLFCEQRLQSEPASIQSELTDLEEVIRGSLQDIRKILFDLRPKDLDQGLIHGLSRLFDDYRERYGLQVLFTCTGQEQHLSSQSAGTLYRIVQEALSNVCKHSCSDRAMVRIEMEERQVTVHIHDEGKGFDPQEAASNNSHYGLTNMRERAQLLDGELRIRTAPGQGTQVIATIPI